MLFALLASIARKIAEAEIDDTASTRGASSAMTSSNRVLPHCFVGDVMSKRGLTLAAPKACAISTQSETARPDDAGR